MGVAVSANREAELEAELDSMGLTLALRVAAMRELSAQLAALSVQLAACRGALKRVGCQDAGSCGTEQPDGRCFVCAALAEAEVSP